MRGKDVSMYNEYPVIDNLRSKPLIVGNKKDGKRLKLTAELSAMFDSMSIRVWVGDRNGQVLYVNGATARTVGLDADDIVGKNIRELFPTHMASKILADSESVYNSGVSLTGLAEEIVWPSGEVRWVQVDKIPYQQKGKGIVGIIVLATDITAHRKTEESLRVSQLNLTEAMDLAHIAYCEVDPVANILIANDAFYSLYGTSAEREGGYRVALDEYARKFVPPEDLPRFYEEIKKQKKGKDGHVSLEGERRIIGGDGKIRHILIRTRNVRDVNGAITKVTGAIQDITERKITEEKLRDIEERFRLFMEYNPIYVFFKDENLITLQLSKNYEEMLGKPMNELIGKSMYDLFPGDLAKSIIQDDLSVFRKGKCLEIEEEFNGKHYKTLKFPIVRVGKPPLLAGFTIDITEQKTSQLALEESLNRLRRLAGATIKVISMSVEARDPYTAGHQKRVSNIARAIATEMGLSSGQVDGIRMAGSIHDLGKIALPAEILSSPRALTDIEFNLIKTHPDVGYIILKDVDFPWPVADIVLQHHERIDGSGYPKGLKNKNISLDARIIAVADVVEAMASHRPYRPALGIDAALEEIEKNKNVLYDPDVVDACLKLFREKYFDIGQSKNVEFDL